MGRRSAAAIVVVLALALLSTAEALCGTDYQRVPGARYSGGTTPIGPAFAAAGEDTCCAQCTPTPECVGYEFRISDSTCTLQQVFGAIASQQSVVDATTVLGARNDIPAQCEVDFAVDVGRLRSSIAASSVDYVSAAGGDSQLTCCTACAQVAGCLGWSLQLIDPAQGTMECTLHFDVGPPDGLTVVNDTSFVHGVTLAPSTSLCSNFTVVSNSQPDATPLAGGPHNITAQAECCTLCDAHPDCNVWWLNPRSIPHDPAAGFQCELYAFISGTKLVNIFPTVAFTGVSAELDRAPVINITYPDVSLGQDTDFVIELDTGPAAISDPDGDELTLSALFIGGLSNDVSPLPSWVVFTPGAVTSTLVGNAPMSTIGTYGVALVATGSSLSTTTVFELVVNPNSQPFLSVALQDPPRPSIGDEFSFQIPFGAFRDTDVGATLDYMVLLDGFPLTTSDFVTFDPATRVVSGVPPNNQLYQITVIARDSSLASVSDTVDVNVNFPPEPAVALPDAEATVGLPFVYLIPNTTFLDTDGDVVRMEAKEQSNRILNAWFQQEYNEVTNELVLSGLPTAGDVGARPIRIFSSDDTVADSSFIPMDVVVAANTPPVINPTLPPLPHFVNLAIGDFVNVSFVGYFTDLDAGDALTFTAGPGNLTDFRGLPWLALDAAVQSVDGQTDETATGNTTVTITATDRSGLSASLEFEVHVVTTLINVTFNETLNRTVDVFAAHPVPAAAELPTAFVEEDEPFVFELPFALFEDPEGRPLTLVARTSGSYGLPSWVTLLWRGLERPRFEGTPANEDIGLYGLEVLAFNDAGQSASVAVSIQVEGTNDVPVVVGASTLNVTGIENAALLETLDLNSVFNDIDGDTLAFTVDFVVSNDSVPAPWLALDITDGVLTLGAVLVPAATQGMYPLEIVARDSAASVSVTVVLTIVGARNGTLILTTPWSKCTVNCELGVQHRLAYCSNAASTIEDDSRCPDLPTTATFQECNDDVCPTVLYDIQPWGSCSDRCYNGLEGEEPTVLRNLECLLHDLEVGSNICDDAGYIRPPRIRDCNLARCDGGFRWLPGPWSACDTACGHGLRTRSVACVNATGTEVAPAACDPALEPAVESPCSGYSCFCNMTANVTCPGVAECVDFGCSCHAGWTGPLCDVPTANSFVRGCDGTFDRGGECCPVTRFIDDNGDCCPVGSVLAGNGTCCSTSVDACGVCGGSAIVVDALGQCCPSVPAMNHVCCFPPDEVDECGVCGGTGDCPWMATINFDYPYLSADAYVATGAEQEAVLAEVHRALALRLGFFENRLALEAFGPQVSTAAPTGATVTFTLQNEDVNEAASKVTLEARSPMLMGSTEVSVVLAERQPECGNGACEIYEACPDAACTGGCAEDCAQWGVVLGCPLPPPGQQFPSLPCAGRGSCEPLVGSCRCFTGYQGNGCTECAPNYEVRVARNVSSCVRIPPQTCIDGFENQDEEGIDCGGSCPRDCVLPSPSPSPSPCNFTLFDCNGTGNGNDTLLTDPGSSGDGLLFVYIGAPLGLIVFVVCVVCCCKAKKKTLAYSPTRAATRAQPTKRQHAVSGQNMGATRDFGDGARQFGFMPDGDSEEEGLY